MEPVRLVARLFFLLSCFWVARQERLLALFWQLIVAFQRYHVISDITSGVDKGGKKDPDHTQTLLRTDY